MIVIRRLGVLIILLLALSAAAASPPPPDSEFFEKRVRPVLVDSCHSCHGPEKAKGGLRVDSREALLAGGDSGPALVAGNPARSLMVIAMKGSDEARVASMPYKKGRLEARVIADIEAWIKMGAPWGRSSGATSVAPKADFSVELKERKSRMPAFQPLRNPAPPRPTNAEWVADPIDAFILKRLKDAGLAPAPPADRRTLLRRLSFDLTGLPPTPEEIRAFDADASPKAVERVVDRLLASPHFGETWARHWLDLVRYGESRGHEFDYRIPNAYHYRDYVIRALNADLPYTDFVLEHIAGDLMAEPRRHAEDGFNESVLATGWWHLGEWVHSPVSTRADETDRVANQIEVFGKTFLGLTIACARCHDHKFDAISQADYYALAGFLRSSDYRQVRFDSIEDNRRTARMLRELDRSNAAEAYRALAASVRPAIESVAKHVKPDAGSSKIELPDDAELIADYRKAPALVQDGFTFRPVRPGDLRLNGGAVTGIHVRGGAAADPSWSDLKLAKGTETSASRGSYVASGRTLRTPSFTLKKKNLYYLVRGAGYAFAVVDSHRMLNGPLHGRTRMKWKDEGLAWRRHALEAYASKDPARPTHHLQVEFTPTSKDFDVLMVIQSDQAPRLPADPLRALLHRAKGNPQALRAALDGPITEESAALLDWAVRNPSLSGVAPAATSKYLKARGELTARIRRESRTAVGIMDGTARNENLLIRGNPYNVGEIVHRRFLQAVAGTDPIPARTASGRLELARQMIDPKVTPLLPRVRVNRIWYHLFGRGLVASVDDFGNMGQPSTHPDLLEHLASAFVKEGSSLKQTIRRIVLSNTYRMSSGADPAALRKDPKNDLLHHKPLRRLPAEAIRDAMLAISGRLDRKLYGPSIPVHLNAFQDGRGKPKNGPLDGAGRRSVYIAVRRNFLSSMLLAFDFPQPFSTMGRRSVSNVPTQALVMKNGPFVRQQTEVWAKRVAAEGGALDDAIRSMFLAAYAREATDSEVKGARAYLDQIAKLHGRKPGQAEVLQDLAHALFQGKEFILIP